MPIVRNPVVTMAAMVVVGLTETEARTPVRATTSSQWVTKEGTDPTSRVEACSSKISS